MIRGISALTFPANLFFVFFHGSIGPEKQSTNFNKVEKSRYFSTKVYGLAVTQLRISPFCKTGSLISPTASQSPWKLHQYNHDGHANLVAYEAQPRS